MIFKKSKFTLDSGLKIGLNKLDKNILACRCNIISDPYHFCTVKIKQIFIIIAKLNVYMRHLY